MAKLSLSPGFLESLARLDASDAKRVAAFLDKLVAGPERASIKSEVVHDAHDRSVRSLRVSKDMRAIVHIDGENTLLLWVARHDEAYAWARDRCISCHPITGEVQVIAEPDGKRRVLQDRLATDEAARIAHGGAPSTGLFDAYPDDYLISLGLPQTWIPTLRLVRNEDMLLAIAEDLPVEVAERLLRLATGELVAPPLPYALPEDWWEARDARLHRAAWAYEPDA
jgi:mRNA-degrading endonuclease RelE of RelBE toxin-antitoxin system